MDPAATGAATPEERFAEATCAFYERCDPWMLSRAGTGATCRTSEAINAHNQLVEAGTTIADDAIQACLSALGTSCEPMGHFTACNFKGNRANGSSCAWDAQCASGACGGGAIGVCGACVPQGKNHDACEGTGIKCGYGLSCFKGACSPVGAMGGECAVSNDCQGGLSCIGNVCNTPHQLGDDCTDNNECDGAKSLVCNRGTCAPFVLRELGDACTDSATDHVEYCAHGLCQDGVCRPGPALGEKARNGECSYPLRPDAGGTCVSGRPLACR